MGAEFHKYQKFLKLEIDRGFDNRAIVGGLEKIVPTWQADARKAGLSTEEVGSVSELMNAYGAQDIAARKESIQKLLGIIKRLQSGLKNSADELDQIADESFPELEKSSLPAQKETEDRPAARPASSNPGLAAPLTVLHGVGPANAEKFKALGCETLGDLLYFFPRRYDDYSQLKTINKLKYGDVVTVIGVVEAVDTRNLQRRGQTVTEAVIFDGTGKLRLTWFNQRWISTKLAPKMQIVVSGKIDMYLGRLVINNPAFEELEREHLHTNRIVPVYPLTAKLTQNIVRRAMYQTINYWAPRTPEYLPANIRNDASLIDLPTALTQVHFPSSNELLSKALHRLAFDEIFMLQLGVQSQKVAWEGLQAEKFAISDEMMSSFSGGLPYQLTGAQVNAINELRADLSSGRPMNRLLQGDVGSGKTIVAAAAILVIASNNAQSVLMAPTSILAEQHYHNLLTVMTDSASHEPWLKPEEIALLVGSTREAEKAEIREKLAAGEIKLIIGTHALLEDPITFSNLQLAIVDEQHRFGVEQRNILRGKGNNPHLLVMTATPIPRSLALTVYGDLDLTLLDEMPAGRQPVSTHVLHPIEINRAYDLINKQIDAGYQAYVIYPLIDAAEDETERKAATAEYERLKNDIFPQHEVGLLHGRMKPDEKEQVMAEFRAGHYKILVSTTVIEVGVDVPNATVMMVEGANRFGLAQLHQLRGRVGRGSAQSYCLLVPENENALENERLMVMAQTTDGFVLAQKDLEQRGPGEFLGERQSGFADLQMADLMDVRLIEQARAQAQALFKDDPALEKPENRHMKMMMERFWTEQKGVSN